MTVVSEDNHDKIATNSTITKVKNPSNKTTTMTTLLRIKRRRSEAPLASKLRILPPEISKKRRISNDVLEISQRLSALSSSDSHVNENNQISDHDSNVTFKRITECTEHDDLKPLMGRKRHIRIVDCERHYDDATILPDTTIPSRKKAKISLRFLNVTQKSKTNKGTPILTPLLSLIDHELSQYHENGPSPVWQQQGQSFLSSLPPHDLSTTISHACSNGRGTVLHAAALWNDAVTARMALEEGVDVRVTDKEGQTALDVARLTGNEELTDLIGEYIEDDCDEPFVYDVYRLKSLKTRSCNETENEENYNTDEDASSTTTEMDAGEELDDLSVEFRNGVSYWNALGELVLEMDPEGQTLDENGETADDDVDSNSEGYEGNDYPEEETDSDDNGFEGDLDPEESLMYLRRGDEDFDSDEDDHYNHNTFRMTPVNTLWKKTLS